MLPIRETDYHITVKNPSHKSSGHSMLVIDGLEKEIGENTTEDGAFVHLEDDHQVHSVVLTL